MDPASQTQRKILIVDDDLILATIYRKKFQAVGFIVDVADSGERALMKITQDRPDIVLLDLMLGDMNGVEVMEILRMNETTRDLPVVVFSSVFLGSLMDQAARAGAARCLNKSGCPPYRVIDAVQAVLLHGNSREGVPELPPLPMSAPPAPRKPTAPPPRPGARPAAGAPAPASNLSDDELQEHVRRDLLEHIHRRIEEIERGLPKWIENAQNFDAPYLPALYRSIRAVAGSAGLVGRLRLGQIAGALEALLKQVKTSRAVLTHSLTRTVSQAVALLPELAREPDSPQAEAFLSPLILVVGNDLEAGADVARALETAQLRAITLADDDIAEQVAGINRFDLVILDIESGGPQNSALAGHLRATPQNENTPIVFLLDREAAEDHPAQGDLGAPDFIAKPFLPLELAVKILLHLQRGRLAVPA